MDIFSKLFSKTAPLLNPFISKHYKNLPPEVINDLRGLHGKIIMICNDLYRSGLLKDKYGLDIDPTDSELNNLDSSKLFVEKYKPCEICGSVRAINLCHIIPRNDGGSDSNDNMLTLCANHHYLFDRNKLTKEEWEKINWDKKPIKIIEYASCIRYKKHLMYWKYKYNKFHGCECGNMEFDEYITETPASKTPYGTVMFPAILTRNFRCLSCNREYSDSVYKGAEYEWWQSWVINQNRIEGGAKASE